MVYKHIGIALTRMNMIILITIVHVAIIIILLSLSCIQVISYLHWKVVQNLLRTTVKFVWMRLKNQYYVQQADKAAVEILWVNSSTLMDLRLDFMILVPIEAEVMVLSG